MIGQRELTLQDYRSMLRRRWWILVIPAVILSAGAYVVSMFLPARYKSETIILVEGPAVGARIVPTAVEDPNQRLATMREEILSRTRLQQIVEKFNLYKEDVDRRPMEELVARLRSTIEVSAVKPMDRTNANGLPGFTIGVSAGQAQLAQRICTEIASMFLQQSIINAEDRAKTQLEFITKELQDAKSKLDEQDAKLAQFQREHSGNLPDQASNNFSMLTALSAQLDSVTQNLSRDQQNKVYLESQLSAQIAAAKLTPGGASPDTVSRQLATLQDQLASLRLRYTEDYPDVIKLKNEIQRLQQKLQEQPPANTQTTASVDKPGMPIDTPQIQQLRAQIHQVDVSIRDRMGEQSRIQQQIAKFQSKLEATPAVQQEYKALTRDYQTASDTYNGLLKTQSTAEMELDLIKRQQGEQFRVLDAPSLPQEPTFPNRKLFALGGLAGGLAIGLMISFLLEAQDTTLRSERDVELLLKLPTLALIPAVEIIKGSRTNGFVNGFPKPPANAAKLETGV